MFRYSDGVFRLLILTVLGGTIVCASPWSLFPAVAAQDAGTPGEPARDETQPASAQAPAAGDSGVAAFYRDPGKDLVMEIQRLLVISGHYKGQADGIAGPRTIEAIRQYQHDKGLSETGLPGLSIYRSLADLQDAAAEAADPGQEYPGPGQELIAGIQRLLIQEGYLSGAADGLMGPKTAQAIGKYQEKRGTTVTGQPSLTLYRDILRRNPAGQTDLAELVHERSQEPTPENPGVSGSSTAEGPILAMDNGTESASTGEKDVAATLPDASAPTSDEWLNGYSLAGTSWLIEDDTGSNLILRLAPEGVVGGVIYPEFWHWSRNGLLVSIEYDNRLGATVSRSGQLTSPDEMSGEAKSSRGFNWTWRATRQAN